MQLLNLMYPPPHPHKKAECLWHIIVTAFCLETHMGPHGLLFRRKLNKKEPRRRRSDFFLCTLFVNVSTNRSVQGRWTHHQWQYQSNQFHQYEPQLSAEEKTIINLLWSYGQVMGSLLLYMIIFGGQSKRSNDYASLQFWVPCHRCILMYIHFETSFF